MSARAATLVSVLASRQSAVDTSPGIQVASVLFVSALTAAAAQVSVPVPFSPVPFTLQPMVVLLGGLALGSRLGATSQVLYLLAGVVGLPVFAASATLPPGPLRLLGPSGGYLMVYPLAAFVVGYLAERGFGRRYLSAVLAMVTGLVVIYAAGATWLGLLARVAGADAAIGMRAAFETSVYPFVIPDLIKLAAAAAVLPTMWRILDRRR